MDSKLIQLIIIVTIIVLLWNMSIGISENFGTNMYHNCKMNMADSWLPFNLCNYKTNYIAANANTAIDRDSVQIAGYPSFVAPFNALPYAFKTSSDRANDELEQQDFGVYAGILDQNQMYRDSRNDGEHSLYVLLSKEQMCNCGNPKCNCGNSQCNCGNSQCNCGNMKKYKIENNPNGLYDKRCNTSGIELINTPIGTKRANSRLGLNVNPNMVSYLRYSYNWKGDNRIPSNAFDYVNNATKMTPDFTFPLVMKQNENNSGVYQINTQSDWFPTDSNYGYKYNNCPTN